MNSRVISAFIALMILSSAMLGTQFIVPVAGDPGLIEVGPGKDFETIQAAIDAAGEGDKIFVHNGTYYETLIISKRLNLIGENKSTTIIDANGTDVVITVKANNVCISGFTIQYGWPRNGIYLWSGTHGNVIKDNIFERNHAGIYLEHSSDNTIDNNIMTHNQYGIRLYYSSRNTIANNTITSSWSDAIYLHGGSSENRIYGNTVSNNTRYFSIGIYIGDYTPNPYPNVDNVIYHNNFIDNTIQARVLGSQSNEWDNGVEGNYWSDYEERYPDAKELDGSGIWDTPYVINVNNTDNYPLVEPWSLPIANFTESAETVYTGEVISFNASASYDPDGGTIVSYFWDFGDENNATGVTTAHSYTALGNYTVTLTVTDDDGATASANATKFVVENLPPVALFTENATTVLTGEAISFNASSSSDPDGSIASYFWDFGDGTNATGVTTTHSYSAAGNYTVSLTVTDNGGATNTATSTKYILRPPVADANGPYSDFEGSPITFDASGCTDVDGDIVLYEWDWDNDGTYDENTTSPTIDHTWLDDFVGTVGLRVKDDDELTHTATASVTVENVAPIAYGGDDEFVNEAVLVSFNGSFTDPGANDTHTYFWNFGDGTNTTDTLTPTHVYTEVGVYTVTLSVTDDDGGVGLDALNVTVLVPVHDIAIINVVPPSTFEVDLGDSVDIKVIVKNEGNVEESFTVNLYAGEGLIRTETATLAAGANGTYTFTWDTAGVLLGRYTIKAEVPPVTGETETADNMMTTDWGIDIVPEFPTLIPLLLVLVILAVSTIILKRKTQKHHLTRRLDDDVSSVNWLRCCCFGGQG